MDIDEKVQYGKLAAYYGALLTDYQRSIFSGYVDCDVSLTELAQQQGVTKQAVRDTIIRVEAILKEYEAKLGLIRQEEQIQQLLSVLSVALETGNTEEAKRQVAQIRALME